MNLIQCMIFGRYAAVEFLILPDTELMFNLRFQKTSDCATADDRPLAGHDPASPQPSISSKRKFEVIFW